MKYINQHSQGPSWLSFLKNPQMVGLLTLAVVVLIGLPITLYEVSQQQEIRQKASVGGDRTDSCGHLQVNFVTNPSACGSSLTVSGMTSFQTTINVVPVNPPQSQWGASDKIVLDWDAASFFCPSKTSPCLQNENLLSSKQCTITKTSNGCLGIAIPQRTPNKQYANNACGYYQDDFAFNFNGQSTIGGSACHYGSVLGVESSPGGATTCYAGINCSTVVPTPTPTRTPTPTTRPTPTPTRAPTPTPTRTPTVTPRPSVTPSPTVTPNPSVSPTPTPTDTPTSTPAPTNTPGPSDTPVPSTVATNTPPQSTQPPTTPRPTLPATGPTGNIFATVGIIGTIIIVVGGLLTFGL